MSDEAVDTPTEETLGPLIGPTKETRYLNANFMLSDADPETGQRELTFVLGPTELMTFLVGPEAQQFIIKRLSGGLEIVGADALPPDPPQEG